MTTYRKDSFLRNAQMRDPIFLGQNTLPKITAQSTDESYIIDPAYDQRPDLLSHKIYGNSRLWWVFAQRNPDELIDPIRDFTAGKIIMLPQAERLNTLLGI